VRDAGDRRTERWGGVPVDCNIWEREYIPKAGRESRDGVQRGMKGSYMDTL